MKYVEIGMNEVERETEKAIKTLKRLSFGFKNLNNFRARILLCEL